jgi:hypothetical protein
LGKDVPVPATYRPPDPRNLIAPRRNVPNGVDVDENLMGGDGPVPLMFGLRDIDGNNLMIVESRD